MTRHISTIPRYLQARKIVAKFGGEAALSKILGLALPGCYRWSHPRPFGLDGLVPRARVEDIQKAAEVLGITLTAEDWAPEKNPLFTEKEKK